MGTARRGWGMVAVAAGVALAAIALLWPGVATYDTITQYAQAVTGQYDDWHPPIMARGWAGLLALGLPGTGPMLVAQMLLYWGGLGLLAGGLARIGARRAALAAIAIGALPPLAGWMIAILKDCQLIAALAAATGLIAWLRLAGRRVPPAVAAAIVLLLGYAALVRANSVFGVVPLGLAWANWFGARRLPARAALTLAGVLAVIGVSGPINHGLLGAERSEVERTLPLFDMAGIAHRVPLATIPQLAPADWARAERRHCYTPFYWDPYTDATKCQWVASAVALGRDDDAPSIFGDWLTMIAQHPVAYAAHRLAHLNSTLRIAMPADERSAAGPAQSLANPYGIGFPARAAARPIIAYAAAGDRTPLGAPIVWLVLAGGLWWTLAGTAPQPARDLGLAAALSAVMQTASFAVVSIASDLRYHLWLVAGSAVAAVLLAACRGRPAGRLRITIAATLAAAALSLVLRG